MIVTRPEIKRDVIELLELAHGYSLMGSIIPMRAAQADANIPKYSEAAQLAAALVNAELDEYRKSLQIAECEKPSPTIYSEALSRAIERAKELPTSEACAAGA